MAESKKLYTTEAINTGGRDGDSALTDGSFKVKITTPKKLGGSDEGHNPEQLFALGYGACFNGALEMKMKEANVSGKSQVTSEVTLNSDPTDNGFKISVVMSVGIEGQDMEKTKELADKAHEFCPYSKATRGNIEVEIKAIEYQA